MKRIALAAFVALAVIACKKTEEVKVDETVIENPADSLVIEKDTVALQTIEDNTDLVEPKSDAKETEVEVTKVDKETFAAFGSKIGADKALTKDQMLKKYASLKKGDTVAVKFRSTIKSVCKKKGCWMKMELPNGQESFVRFKDYGFFVPLNADDSEAIVSGRAFIDEVSVEELRHYAKDGGKSQEEIEKITQPKITYAFTADGVLIRE
jgi:uncharacterized protein involved in high-affinity Fe2+ transport